MYKKQTTKTIHMNKEEIKEEDKISVNEPIENTPFRVVGNEHKGYAIVIGKYAMTGTVPTIEEAKNLLNTNIWNIITNLISIFPELLKDIESIIGILHPDNTKVEQKNSL